MKRWNESYEDDEDSSSSSFCLFCTVSHICVYACACNLIWWAVWGFKDVKKLQEIMRNKAKMSKILRMKKPKIQQKPPRFCGGFCWPFFIVKLWIWKIWAMFGPTNWGYSHIYIYIHIHTGCFFGLGTRTPKLGTRDPFEAFSLQKYWDSLGGFKKALRGFL